MPKLKIKVPNKLRKKVKVKLVEKGTKKQKPKRYKLKKGQTLA